ncbi:MAG TPA: DUF2069 domain-containing protein [Rhodanobacteraceae bacterium]|jgi:uncharacterized membrane protein|nr:DUF2069 domain-containing protein [Rhodanobacteraceae bacterium]
MPERVGIGAWIALIALQFAWYLVMAPPADGSPWIALALTLPALVLPAFALRSGRRRTLLWVGVVALFYFCHGVVAAWIAPAARVPALIESGLCVVVIGSLGWAVRRDRAQRASAH